MLKYCFCFFVCVLIFWPQAMQDLSFPTRDQTCTSNIGKPCPHQWTTGEVALVGLIDKHFWWVGCGKLGRDCSGELWEAGKGISLRKQKFHLGYIDWVMPLIQQPHPFWHQEPVSWKIIFPWKWGRGDGVRMIRVHYIYYALYFCYYYNSSTSDHQALGPGVWGPLI